MGCAEDVLSRLCIDDDATFDIEEVSVLEDAMGEPGTHDAVIVGMTFSSRMALPGVFLVWMSW